MKTPSRMDFFWALKSFMSNIFGKYLVSQYLKKFLLSQYFSYRGNPTIFFLSKEISRLSDKCSSNTVFRVRLDIFSWNFTRKLFGGVLGEAGSRLKQKNPTGSSSCRRFYCTYLPRAIQNQDIAKFTFWNVCSKWEMWSCANYQHFLLILPYFANHYTFTFPCWKLFL